MEGIEITIGVFSLVSVTIFLILGIFFSIGTYLKRHNILFFSFFFYWSFSQESAPKNPRVGLVLSGGGAKGLAHVGVLKTLDSLGVRVDYVAGTSMGAVVGGLYASGYTGKQIDSIISATNFDLLISDDVPRKSKTFYERKNAEKYNLYNNNKQVFLHHHHTFLPLKFQ